MAASRRRKKSESPSGVSSTAPGPAPAVPKTRQITRWLLTRPDRLQADEQAQLEAIRARCPHIDALAGHVTAFAETMTACTGSRDLEAWLAAVEADDQAGLRSFTVGIHTARNASRCPVIVSNSGDWRRQGGYGGRGSRRHHVRLRSVGRAVG